MEQNGFVSFREWVGNSDKFSGTSNGHLSKLKIRLNGVGLRIRYLEAFLVYETLSIGFCKSLENP